MHFTLQKCTKRFKQVVSFANESTLSRLFFELTPSCEAGVLW